MAITTPVQVWLPGEAAPVLAGEFVHDSTGPTGRFTYSVDYVAAKRPPLAPDMPVRAKPLTVSGGNGIFPLFLRISV